ncbi:uncharacterized protein LOC113386371 [Ctenocephalides felis]|uniref:uncharacterized protein LOC113386371 n=1 Tax=Ctenocephalides felis TaxID=7515 RepID=UPI000E6E3446|nr:uncharacterized protein LOC113386371 [Ctenocephalides felis]
MEIRLISADKVSKKSQIYFADIFKTNNDIAIVKSKDGMNFYEYKNGKVNHIHTEVQFRDQLGWDKVDSQIVFGRFFADSSILGVASLKSKEPKFYGVMKEKLMQKQPSVFPVKANYTLITEFLTNSNNELLVHDLFKAGQDQLIVRSGKGIAVFKIDKDSKIYQILNLNCCQRKSSFDKIFFANVTNSAAKDIIHINDAGIHMYKYETNKYEKAVYNSILSTYRGFGKHNLDNAIIADVDIDGLDDLVLTGPFGPSIFTYNNYSNMFYDVFDKDLNADSSCDKVLQITHISNNSFLSDVLVAKDNKVYISNLKYDELSEELPTYNHDIDLLPEHKNKSFVAPKIVVKQNIKEIVLLRDLLDVQPFYKSVDILTGKPEIQLSLVKLNAPLDSWNLNYNVHNANTAVGVGWDTEMSYIALYDSNSVFPEDHNYYWFYRGNPQILQKDNTLSTSEILYFYIEDKSNHDKKITAKYTIKNEAWELDVPAFKHHYGKSNLGHDCNAITWTANWKNYRGTGTDVKSILRSPQQWYLCADVSKESKNIINYNYYSVDITIPGSGVKYTREIYLKSVDDNVGNSITFHYNDRIKTEFILPEVISKDGINPARVQTKYLSSYNLKTKIYDQTIIFHYQVQNDKRLLSSISQSDDYVKSPILSFQYEQINEIWMIKSAVLPNGLMVNYAYKNLQAFQHQELTKFEVQNDLRILYGNDFIAVSYIKGNENLVITVFSPEMTQLMTTSITSKNCKSYIPAQGDDYFALTTFYENYKEIYIFQKQSNGTWPKGSQKFRYSTNDLTIFGSNFLVVAKEFKVIIIEGKIQKNWQIVREYNTNKKYMYLAVNNDKFVVYDDNSLYFGYKDVHDNWNFKNVLQVKNVISNMVGTIDMFDIKDITKSDIKGFFMRNSLQFSNNIALLYSWSLHNGQMYTNLYTFVFDGNKSIAKYKTFTVKQDNLQMLSKEMTTDDGNTITFGGKFIDELEKERTKSIQDDRRHAKEINKQVDDIIKETKANITTDIQKNKEFILDLSPYLAELASNYVAANSTIYQFTGDDWKQDTQNHKTEDTSRKEQQKKVEENAKLLINSTLTDKYSSVEIAQFYPNKLDDEEVGYFGFEDYEKDEITINGGSNYLHLDEGVFSGSFQPRNQNLTFISSCWVRPHNTTFILGEITPYFKVALTDSSGYNFYGILSEAKYKSGDWFYLESVIEYPYAKSILDNIIVNNTDYNRNASNFIGMTLTITSGLYMTLDIDHIRLLPIDSKFEINVYDNNRISAVIHSNGLVSRNFYDVLKDNVAHVNAYGILDKFQARSKSLDKRSSRNSDRTRKLKFDFRPSSTGGGKLIFSNLFEITNSELKIYSSPKAYNIPVNGELLWIMENGHCFIWINGNLYYDQDLLSENPVDIILPP